MSTLRSMRQFHGFAIGATDDIIGHVRDLYFDDEDWTIRYFVVQAGGWLSSRKVLISPISVRDLDWRNKTLAVSLTRDQVKTSPDIDTAKPVSRQHEMQYLGYYGYAYYWGGFGLWGEDFYPWIMQPGDRNLNAPAQPAFDPIAASGDLADASFSSVESHLRSCDAVTRYNLHASDGEIGHVEDMLVDDKTWAIRYLVINTSNWWLGHRVLIASQWIEEVSWANANVEVNLTRQTIKEAPTFSPSMPLDRAWEAALHEHYGRRSYWEDEAQRNIERTRV